MDDKLKTKIDTAVQVWTEFWDDNLEAVYLYGSAARGEYSEKTSDINLMLQVTAGDKYDRWPDAANIAGRWFKKGFAIPLVMTESYIRSTADVYPIEFLDMKLFHEPLFGEDLLAELDFEKEHLRIQAEREVKGKWVQLRQAALERGGNTSDMRNLLAMSVPTWVAVFQALLVIADKEVPRAKKDVLQAGADLAGVDGAVFRRLEEMRRERKALNRNAAWEVLLDTLKQVDALARYADQLGN